MAKKSHGLGRGLDALLPDEPAGEAGQVIQIPLGNLDPSADQPRKIFSEENISMLAQSIREQGILQPILVTAGEDGRYTIVAGERRWRAAREAGLSEVPCLVRDVTDHQRMEIALIENLQREDLNPVETAMGIRSLMDTCGYTQDEAARRLGKSRPSVANLLRILSLPEAVIEMIREGVLSAGHARVLAGLDNAEDQMKLAEETVSRALSVRQLEQAAAGYHDRQEGEKPKDRRQKNKSPEISGFEDRLREWCGMRAEIRGSEHKGKVILQYYTREELEHLYELIGQMDE